MDTAAESCSEPQTKKAKMNEEEGGGGGGGEDVINVDDPSPVDIDVDDPSPDEESCGSDEEDSPPPYNSDSDYDNPEHREQFRRYRQQVAASEGFDVDLPECPVLGGIMPFSLDGPTDRFPYQGLMPCAEFAVKENRLQLVEVIKANRSLAADGLMYYITLSAKSCSATTDDEQPKIYQAKVRYRFADDGMALELFRVKKDENPASQPAN